MSNHYHLLIETPEPNLSRGMRRLNGVYTQIFNRGHRRVGHLLQGRYKSILVDREAYLLELCRYVALNPVRANLVDDPAQWPWSSYAANAGLAPSPDWLATDVVLGRFGQAEADARAAYRRFVMDGIGRPSPWGDLRGQIWLGKEDFLKRMEHLAQVKPLTNVAGPQARPARPTPEEVLSRVAAAFGVERQEILDRSAPRAYQCAVYLLRRAANLSLGKVAALFGVSPSRVSHIQCRVEQDGDGPMLLQLVNFGRCRA